MGAILYQLLVHARTTAAHLALLNTEELRSLGIFANTAAGLSSTRYGGIASLPALSEVEQLAHSQQTSW
jgi:sugar/nucleoside kinase (ribokinase family)